MLERHRNHELIVVLWFSRWIVFTQDNGSSSGRWRWKGECHVEWNEARGHPVALRLSWLLREKKVVSITYLDRKRRFKVPVAASLSFDRKWARNLLIVVEVRYNNEICFGVTCF